jgi:DNA-binding MarR family transcriptional regulator
VLELTPAGEAAAREVHAAFAALERRVRERAGARAVEGFERVLREL